MRIGVDVGGTHTDAVVLDDGALIGGAKALTTEDIASGVIASVRDALKQSGVDARAIAMITIGTTQFTNAVVERRALARAAAIRIGAQSSAALPIAAKWPEDIRAACLASDVMIDGGHEYDGAPILPVDETALDAAIDALEKSGVAAIAITSVFSTSNPEAETLAARKIAARLPHARTALSHQLGQIGLYQRENATLLNASLMRLAEDVVDGFEKAFAALDLVCPLFISQNDGTLMSADFARAFPVFTFSSGPTNSMRGAAYLSGETNAMVVDVGGTTSDIGMLIDGFPRPSGAAVCVGGVLTNFRMPDVLAIGLGGGSVVSEDGGAVGPRSVGRALPQKGLIFGGDTMTASDIAAAAGRAGFGDPSKAQLPETTINAALAIMRQTLEDGVDKMKTNDNPMPLIVVGGGGFLVPDALQGVSEIIRPDNGGVANAIGAAFAQISGEAETIYAASARTRDTALEEAKNLAAERACQAGAARNTIAIAEIDETPMSYLSEPGAVIRVKAIGDVDLTRFAPTERSL